MTLLFCITYFAFYNEVDNVFFDPAIVDKTLVMVSPIFSEVVNSAFAFIFDRENVSEAVLKLFDRKETILI